MKISLQKFITVFLLSLVLLSATPSAYATVKIDIFSPASDLVEKINKVKSKIENAYGHAMEILHGKVLAATGVEGAALFDAFIPMNFSNLRYVGANIYSGNFNFMDNLRLAVPQLNNLRVDFYALERLRLDHLNALNMEMAAKLHAIDQRMIELDKMIEAAPYADNVAELKEERDLLIAQKMQLQAKQNILDPQTESFNDRIALAGRSIRSIMSDINSDQIQNSFNQMLDGELGKLNIYMLSASESQDIYDQAIGKFFLSEGRRMTAENVGKIKKDREKAYYEAVVDAMTVGVETFRKASELAERVKNMRQGSTEADGLYGARNMNVGLDIENARMAALYTKLLLAKIKLETTKDLRSRTNTYRIFGNRNPTEFNLENYQYKPTGFVGGLWNKGVQAGYGALGLK